MSESQEDAEKKDSVQKKTDQTATDAQKTSQPTKPTAPRVGTPIGQSPSPRPQIGTPFGTQPAHSSATTRQSGCRHFKTNCWLSNRRSATASWHCEAFYICRLACYWVYQPQFLLHPDHLHRMSAKQLLAKPPESKSEISRRNFIKGLAIIGGVVAVGQFVALGPYLQGSVGSSNISSQVIEDSTTGKPITTSDVSVNNWKTFVYPRTGNPNIDNDTFGRLSSFICQRVGVQGDTAQLIRSRVTHSLPLSRVCVHLWCLWGYVPSDNRGICPCHGSQYIPGGPAGSAGCRQPRSSYCWSSFSSNCSQ